MNMYNNLQPLYRTSKISKKILFLRMVSFMRYIFFFSLLFLMACGKNEFTLIFDMSQEITDNYNVTYYATDNKGGLTIQAVASVRDGKCELGGVTKLPTLVYITQRNSKLPLIVYATKGSKIKISGDNANPLQWLVEGNEINNELSDWRLKNKDLLLKNDADSINVAIGNYIENNPENPVSTLLMLCYYNRKVNERGYNTLMGQLKGNARNSEWSLLAARSDHLYNFYTYPARLESLVMRSDKEGSDTLLINQKDPVLLLFWQTGYSERKSLIDSLKVLEKELPDSALIIADICIDADSVAWKNAMKKDSLENIKRFWAPMGLADVAVTKFKVKTLPYFIVFDKDGNQTYSGSDLSDAIKDYREMENKK